MDLTGWGRYPHVNAKILRPGTEEEAQSLCVSTHSPLIPHGLGRSYGDSALASTVLDSTRLDYLVDFDNTTGALTCAAGVSLAEILKVFVPRGWFPMVTPGTRFITVGGAIASDVHGKNHHLEGSFCDHLDSFRIGTVRDGVVHCSRDSHPELFRATCGGMGLTGVILEATFKLKPIESANIKQTTIKAPHLDEAFALFDAHSDATYLVAWIDCLARGPNLGRSLITLGEHATEGDLQPGKAPALTVPCDMPSALLNGYSIRAFNYVYYHRIRRTQNTSRTHYQPFFYPLDGIRDWNRLYGRKGFLQYQFVLPRDGGLDGMKTILQRIADSGKGSFLAVLKAFGKGNDNMLSFPIAGYTLALDFKIDRDVFKLLDGLDDMVIDYGGRIYLAKDARMSETTFKAGYPCWGTFAETRQTWGADKIFHSHQSQRLGL